MNNTDRLILNEEGWTLIEALVSMVIIVIIALSGIALYFNSSELERMALNKKIATELANSKMEGYRSADYSTLTAGVTTADVVIGGLDAKVSDGLGETVTIADIDGDSPPDGTIDYKRVQVDINWEEAGKIERTFNISLITHIKP